MSPCFFVCMFLPFSPMNQKLSQKNPIFGGVAHFFPDFSRPNNTKLKSNGWGIGKGQRQAMLFGEDVAFGGVFRRGRPKFHGLGAFGEKLSTELG